VFSTQSAAFRDTALVRSTRYAVRSTSNFVFRLVLHTLHAVVLEGSHGEANRRMKAAGPEPVIASLPDRPRTFRLRGDISRNDLQFFKSFEGILHLFVDFRDPTLSLVEVN